MDNKHSACDAEDVLQEYTRKCQRCGKNKWFDGNGGNFCLYCHHKAYAKTIKIRLVGQCEDCGQTTVWCPDCEEFHHVRENTRMEPFYLDELDHLSQRDLTFAGLWGLLPEEDKQ